MACQRRSNEDKRKAVVAALQHPKGAKLSDRQIAEHCGVSSMFVGKCRDELSPSINGLQIDTRIATRGGKEYEIDTTNIGRPLMRCGVLGR
jgi:hypothetical protein